MEDVQMAYNKRAMTHTIVPLNLASEPFKPLQSLGEHIDARVLLALALVAFEIFNFSTTRYALSDLLGPVSFGAIRWATILAIAFCAIDVVGLVRFFSLGQEGGAGLGAWYLVGAWLLGATMNALMAWWAVSVMMLNSGSPGNTFLLDYLPLAAAIIIWLTRLLFIGAFGLAAGHLFDGQD
jgi:hypothetical protein